MTPGKTFLMVSYTCFSDFFFFLTSESHTKLVDSLVCNRLLWRILILVNRLRTNLKVQQLASGCDAKFWSFSSLFCNISLLTYSFSSHGQMSPLSLLYDDPEMPKSFFFFYIPLQGPGFQVLSLLLKVTFTYFYL